MTIRAIPFVLLALLLLLVLTTAGDSLPMPIDAVPAQAAQQPRLLFSPCPLAPRNLPLPTERKA